MSSEEINTALANLDAIKNGDSPNIDAPTSDDPLDIARDEVNRLYDEIQELSTHLDRANVHVGVARWKNRNGVCKYNRMLRGQQRFGQKMSSIPSKDGHHTIVINERILEDGNEDDFIDTVRHELAHAVAYEKWDKSQKHNHNWKAMASKLGADPSSTHHKHESVDAPYVFACPNGCFENGRQKRSKLVKRPWNRGRYCNTCGETPVACDSDIDPESLEPGEVQVSGVPWTNKDEYFEHQ